MVMGWCSFWCEVVSQIGQHHAEKNDRNMPVEDIRQVAETFVLANCFDPKLVELKFSIP